MLNKAVMDVGGYELPYIAMANNKIERKERAAKSALYLLGAFASPLLLLPLFNRVFLRKSGIIKKFWSKKAHIIRLSNDYLTGSSRHTEKGIK